jgi:hypothetical protein
MVARGLAVVIWVAGDKQGNGKGNGDGNGNKEGKGDQWQQHRQWLWQRGWRASNGHDNDNGNGDGGGTKDRATCTTTGERGMMVVMGHGLFVIFVCVWRDHVT